MKKTAFVVDDEGDVVELVELFLRLSGWEVVCARSGEEAVRLVPEIGPVDLFVLDVWMRTMNGYDLLGLLRGSAGNQRVPVLFMTGQDPARVRAGLADAVVRKPFTQREFLGAVGRALESEPKGSNAKTP